MVSEASILAMLQVIRIAATAVEQHQKGDLTRAQLAEAWKEINGKVERAELAWLESKEKR